MWRDCVWKMCKNRACSVQTISSFWCLFNSSWWSGNLFFFASSWSLLAFILCSHFLFSKALWSSVFPSCDTILTETQKDFMISGKTIKLECECSRHTVCLPNLLWVIRSSLWSSWWLLEAVKGLRGFWGLMRLLPSSSLCSGGAWSSEYRSSCSIWCVCITEAGERKKHTSLQYIFSYQDCFPVHPLLVMQNSSYLQVTHSPFTAG